MPSPSCTGTAAVVGLATGACVLAAAALLGGAVRSAFLALGLTLPGLLLQDSWRYSFFALGRGSQAFLNDIVWAVTLLPALVLLRVTGHANVFWFVFAWGAAAAVAAAVGPLQARVIPRLSGTWEWVSRHRDLGPRYLAEGTSYSAAAQLRTYGIGLILGLAAVGLRAGCRHADGPHSRSSSSGCPWSPFRRPPESCVARHGTCRCSACSSAVDSRCVGLAWGVVLLVALPRGLGDWLLGPIWRPTYPLVLPQTLFVMGQAMRRSAPARACTPWGPRGGACARPSSRRPPISAAGWWALFAGGAVGTCAAPPSPTWIGALLCVVAAARWRCGSPATYPPVTAGPGVPLIT